MSKNHDCDNPTCDTKNVPEVQNRVLPKDWQKLSLTFSKSVSPVVRVSFDLCPVCVDKIHAQLDIPADAPEKKTSAEILWETLQELIQEEVEGAVEEAIENR